MAADLWDVLVVGAGHAGCEAALAAARLGQSTLVVTLSRESVAHMACNPSVGGPAKGHLVREIDALGGEMARVADATTLQLRRLNLSKGPAVRATRAQVDRRAYQGEMRRRLEEQPGLEIQEGEVVRLAVDGRYGHLVLGLDGDSGAAEVRSRTVILTTGTFLRGLCHRGLESWPEGRHGEPPARHLSDSLRALGLTLGRLKTGTPARLDGSTVDTSCLEEQPGDPDCPPFSLDTPRAPTDQIACHIAFTTPTIHELLRRHLDRSPLYRGVIEGVGPRYCPSIEDKVVRFPDRLRHQVFLEPEDRARRVVYPSGISSSMPDDVQEAMIRGIDGLADVRILRLGYAVEYDFVPPTQLDASLGVRGVPGLFLAGQINGTSGYEEAAGQGLLAGINAARLLRGEAPLVLRRDQAYLGLLVDDLTTKGTAEPYRLLTSRAEHRLLLREDNADLRLREIGHRVGLVGSAAAQRIATKRALISEALAALDRIRLRPTAETVERAAAAGIGPLRQATTARELLRRPGVRLAQLETFWSGAADVPADVSEQVEIQIRYEGYIRRQEREVARAREMESRRLPAELDYASLGGLSREVREKLAEVQPRTLGQASRVPGVTPAAIARLVAFLESRGRHDGKGEEDRRCR